MTSHNARACTNSTTAITIDSDDLSTFACVMCGGELHRDGDQVILHTPAHIPACSTYREDTGQDACICAYVGLTESDTHTEAENTLYMLGLNDGVLGRMASGGTPYVSEDYKAGHLLGCLASATAYGSHCVQGISHATTFAGVSI